MWENYITTRLLRLEQAWRKASSVLAVNKAYSCVLKLRILPSYNTSALKNHVTRQYNFFLRAGKLYLEAFFSKMRNLLLLAPSSFTFSTTEF